MAYLPASQGGLAIGDILFGMTNPSGKLPYTYPQYANDVGVPYYHKYSDVGATSPLYPFGYGLSYTTYVYSNLTLSASTITLSDTLTIQVTVKNTGYMEGKEVVFCYLSDLYASITPEVKMLKRFTKISLQQQESQVVTFKLTSQDLSFIGINDVPVVEAGLFTITVGNLSANFTLTI